MKERKMRRSELGDKTKGAQELESRNKEETI